MAMILIILIVYQLLHSLRCSVFTATMEQFVGVVLNWLAAGN
jgi:hypothetical protein